MVTPDWTDSKRVLVVDDEPWIAELLARMLAADGHEVDTAPNGAVALARVRERSYDLIVCDLRMPELDGQGFYQALERSHPELLPRVVFITGSAIDAPIERFLHSTRAPFLNKPFTQEDVREGTRDILEQGVPEVERP